MYLLLPSQLARLLLQQHLLILILLPSQLYPPSQRWFMAKIGSDIDGEATGDVSGGFVSLSSDGTVLAILVVYRANNELSSGHNQS
jgi:hypothetical protein